MIRQIAAASVVAMTVACATQTSGTPAEPASPGTDVIRAISAKASAPTASQLDAAYDCAIEAIADAGYPVRRSDQRRVVSGQIRDNVGAEDSRVQGDRVGGTGSKREAGEEGTPYVIDAVVAGVSVNKRTGRLQVTTEAYTGAALTSRSGYVKRPASARGVSAANHARACANIAE
jgi:hypothetical protein